jgi:hypothetical protein
MDDGNGKTGVRGRTGKIVIEAHERNAVFSSRMEQTTDEITQAALSLPISERSQLVDRLNESLTDFQTTDETTDSWVRLAVRRLEEVRSGAAESIDGPTGLSEMRNRVRG